MRKKESIGPEPDSIQLSEEVSELKDLIREISRRLTRIEMLLKQTPAPPPPKSLAEPKIVDPPPIPRPKSASLSATQVLEVYEELRFKAKQGHEEEVKQKLAAMNLSELNLLCWELGTPVAGKNPTRKKMLDAILSRIKQSLMLSRHIDRRKI